MSSARPRALLASTSFHLSLVFAAILLVAFVCAGAGLWFLTKSAAEQAGRDRIRVEMDSLQDEIRHQGLDAAVAAIRVRQRKTGSLEYRLVGADGAVLAGDLEVGAQPQGWSTLYLPDSAAQTASPDLVLLQEAIPDGGSLTIAEDLERTEWVRYAMLRTLFWVATAALLFSVGAGYFASRSALGRMDGVFDAMERVGGGDLSVRAPVRARSDGSDVDVLARQINAMLTRVDALVGNLRRVSTDIAHDLRTPLTHVRQQLDAAATAPDLDTAKAATRTAQEMIDGVLRTFAATLRLAEIEAGAARARFAPVDLAAIVERVGHAYRPEIEASGRTFDIESVPSAIVQGDADLLTQALANLLDNAMTHTPAGATIAVRLHTDADALRLEVEDAGPGVPAADRPRVLEPFVRLDRSRGAPGAGLGLSIVSAVARLHGASLALEDAEPGLRATIEWPSHGRSGEGADAVYEPLDA
jgi:signal transduction histidine kinase